MPKPEEHYITRSGWLRAAVLGANDGIISTASIAVGVASAGAERPELLLASLAAMTAGALSMAAGEYISVSSQADLEAADLAREAEGIKAAPTEELEELTAIYINRGLSADLAKAVAIELSAHNALEAHARDELGISEITEAQPMQAAIASGIAFIGGAVLPVLVAFLAPMDTMVWAQYLFTLLFLVLLGYLSARTGGASVVRPILRIVLWGTLAMAGTALVGWLFGVQVG